MQGGIEIAELSPIVIPVFVSNLGCRHRCIFCDQLQNADPMPPGHVAAHVEEFLSHCRSAGQRKRVLAFYGGSFTGISNDVFEGYLDVARTLMDRGIIHSAKASTRPDMVSKDIVDRLAQSGFEELEIGIQSMDDEVLKASSRGHTREEGINACNLVRESGMKLGVQIMPGLPGEDRKSFRTTVDEIVCLNPDTARIYPTVVLAGTALEEAFLKGCYQPLSMDEAISRTLYAVIRLENAKCSILRMGIPSSSALRVTAGPYHESFGFLVRASGYRIMAGFMVSRLGKGCKMKVTSKDVPELVGYRRSTVEDLNFSYSFDDTLPRGYIRADAARESACIQLQDILEYIL